MSAPRWSEQQFQAHQDKLARKIHEPEKKSRATTSQHVQSVNNVCKLNIKPLSVNRAWEGRRFKTKEYQQYESAVLALLPNIILPATNLKVYYEFGFSVKSSDLDNPCKLLTDILCKKYHFDDREIYEMKIKKVIVNKGEEYALFHIESIT